MTGSRTMRTSKTQCGLLRYTALLLASSLCLTVVAQAQVSDGSVLPFPPAPMAGKTAERLQDSTMVWPTEPQRLPIETPT